MTNSEMFINYYKDAFDADVIIFNEGFVTFRILENDLSTVYLQDLYIKPEYRGKKESHAIAKILEEESKKRGCSTMLTTINKELVNVTRSMKVILGYGFKYSHDTSDGLYFIKEINI